MSRPFPFCCFRDQKQNQNQASASTNINPGPKTNVNEQPGNLILNDSGSPLAVQQGLVNQESDSDINQKKIENDVNNANNNQGPEPGESENSQAQPVPYQVQQQTQIRQSDSSSSNRRTGSTILTEFRPVTETKAKAKPKPKAKTMLTLINHHQQQGPNSKIPKIPQSNRLKSPTNKSPKGFLSGILEQQNIDNRQQSTNLSMAVNKNNNTTFNNESNIQNGPESMSQSQNPAAIIDVDDIHMRSTSKSIDDDSVVPQIPTTTTTWHQQEQDMESSRFYLQSNYGPGYQVMPKVVMNDESPTKNTGGSTIINAPGNDRASSIQNTYQQSYNNTNNYSLNVNYISEGPGSKLQGTQQVQQQQYQFEQLESLKYTNDHRQLSYDSDISLRIQKNKKSSSHGSRNARVKSGSPTNNKNFIPLEDAIANNRGRLISSNNNSSNSFPRTGSTNDYSRYYMSESIESLASNKSIPNRGQQVTQNTVIDIGGRKYRNGRDYGNTSSTITTIPKEDDNVDVINSLPVPTPSSPPTGKAIPVASPHIRTMRKMKKFKQNTKDAM